MSDMATRNGRPHRAGYALMLIAAVPGAAIAQAGRIDQDQLGSRSRSLAVPQLSEPSPQTSGSPKPPPPTGPIVQITAPTASDQVAPQVTTERRGASTPAQLSRGGTAEPPAPLSRPSEGRIGAVTAIAGKDRCDPGRRAPLPTDCARVIEKRSAEFARPNPLTLSPEQRLLVDQRLREANSPGQRTPVVRPTDATQADPDTPEGQAVAAIVRDQIRPDDRKSPVDTLPSSLPDGTAAVIEAIINNGGGSSSPR